MATSPAPRTGRENPEPAPRLCDRRNCGNVIPASDPGPWCWPCWSSRKDMERSERQFGGRYDRCPECRFPISPKEKGDNGGMCRLCWPAQEGFGDPDRAWKDREDPM